MLTSHLHIFPLKFTFVRRKIVFLAIFFEECLRPTLINQSWHRHILCSFFGTSWSRVFSVTFHRSGLTYILAFRNNQSGIDGEKRHLEFILFINHNEQTQNFCHCRSTLWKFQKTTQELLLLGTSFTTRLNAFYRRKILTYFFFHGLLGEMNWTTCPTTLELSSMMKIFRLVKYIVKRIFIRGVEFTSTVLSAEVL